MKMLEIDLDDTYQLEYVAGDLMEFNFRSPTLNGEPVLIVVRITVAANDFFDEFLNLSFGPKANGVIDDLAVLKHVNPSKVLSTVLLCGAKFLDKNPEEHIGINGSDLRRAYMYYRIFQKNYDYLNRRLNIYGVKFYVRVPRGNDKNDLLQIDPNEVTFLPFTIDKNPIIQHKSLFNYFFVTSNKPNFRL